MYPPEANIFWDVTMRSSEEYIATIFKVEE
jgi:hypothetical protein